MGRRPSVTRVLVGTLHGNLLGLLAVFPVIKAHLSRGFRLPDDRRINQAGTGGARNWLGRVRLPRIVSDCRWVLCRLLAMSRPRVTHFGTSAQGRLADILAIDPHFQGYGNPWFSVQAGTCTVIPSFPYPSWSWLE